MKCVQCGNVYDDTEAACPACGEIPNGSQRENFPDYISNTSRTKAVLAMLFMSILIEIIAAAARFTEINFLYDVFQGVYADTDNATLTALAQANDDRLALIGLVRLAVYFGAGCAFFLWSYRISKNARALGANGMDFSPAWTIGWFFIPLANMFMPYRVFQELWQVSVSPQSWRNQPASPLVLVWWLSFVAIYVLGYVVFIKTAAVTQLDEIRHASQVLLLFDVLCIAAAIPAIMLVMKLSALQESHAKSNTA